MKRKKQTKTQCWLILLILSCFLPSCGKTKFLEDVSNKLRGQKAIHLDREKIRSMKIEKLFFFSGELSFDISPNGSLFFLAENDAHDEVAYVQITGNSNEEEFREYLMDSETKWIELVIGVDYYDSAEE